MTLRSWRACGIWSTAWKLTPEVQVVVFDSANPDFYMAHIDLVRRGQAATNARFLEAFARPEVKARVQRFMEKAASKKTTSS